MKRLFYWLYRRINEDSLPCRHEILNALGYNTINSNIYKAMKLYIIGYTLEDIAEELNVTRERVRQYLIKGARTARNSK